MMGYSDDQYATNDTTNVFLEPSTIPIPDMTQDDPQGGSFSAPDAAMGGWGTGGETLEADGSVTTRHKAPGTGGIGGILDGGSS